MAGEAKLTYIRNLYKKKLSCGKSLLELTVYDDIGMWWVADILFYEFISREIDDTPIDRSNQHKLLSVGFKHRKLFIRVYNTVGIYMVMLYDILVMTLVRLMAVILGNDRQNEKKTSPKILFIAQDRQWQDMLDYRTNCVKKSDAFFDSVVMELSNKGYHPVGIYPIDLYPIRGLRIFGDKLKNWYLPHRPLNYYWSIGAWKKEREASKHFKESWNYLVRDEIFKKMCKYDGKDLHQRIMDELAIYFSILFPHLVKYIEIARTMIRAEMPSLILLLNEHWWWEKTLVIAARLEGVPTMAIQHGAFSPLHKSYRYTRDEIAPDGNVKSPYCPIVNKTAVYGMHYRDILTMKGAYPPTNVAVTGQPRYDILHHACEIYSRDRCLKKYGINRNHKVILWTMQCSGLSEMENVKNLKCVFKTMQELEDVVLVLKPHPIDTKKHRKTITRYMNTYDTNVLIVPGNSDTFEQIYACDLMITRHSTTAMEAVALNKPVIILNLSGEPDPVEYVREGIALGVYAEEELKPAIERLLKDDSDLATNRAKYIREYLYKIDGNATTRIVKLVDEIVSGGI